MSECNVHNCYSCYLGHVFHHLDWWMLGLNNNLYINPLQGLFLIN